MGTEGVLSSRSGQEGQLLSESKANCRASLRANQAGSRPSSSLFFTRPVFSADDPYKPVAPCSENLGGSFHRRRKLWFQTQNDVPALFD
jgi:hypothetical protein